MSQLIDSSVLPTIFIFVIMVKMNFGSNKITKDLKRGMVQG